MKINDCTFRAIVFYATVLQRFCDGLYECFQTDFAIVFGGGFSQSHLVRASGFAVSTPKKKIDIGAFFLFKNVV